ncbi:MAG: hypothetical protein SNJ29_15360 [Rikenellaceae bacterium]
MKWLLKKLLAPLGGEVQVISQDGAISIRMPDSTFHNRVVRILSNEQLLDKVILEIPLFSYRLKRREDNGLMPFQSWELIRRKCMEGKRRTQKALSRMPLTSREEREILNLLRS